MAELRHLYASLDEFDNYLRDNGETTFASQSAAIIGRKLAIGQAVSRRIDEVCERSAHGSGFGPRTGTNYYDPPGGNCLYLDDDLLAITTVTTLDTPNGTATTLTDETDFFKRRGRVYGISPYRELIIHEDSSKVWGSATRGGAIVIGSWAFEDRRSTSASLLNGALTASATSVVVDAGTDFSVGHTLLVDSEQMYITAISTNTLTVERGVNGTTAATHADNAAINVYVYDSRVHEVQLRLWLRRWKARDAGADGSDGGGDMPGIGMREGEDTIIRRGLDRLMYRSAG